MMPTVGARLPSRAEPAATFTSVQAILVKVPGKRGPARATSRTSRLRGHGTQGRSTRSQGVLIISRRINESLHIGGRTTVTVLSVHGTQVQLGIDAPREIVVDRAEVFHRKQLEAPGRASAEGRPGAPRSTTPGNAAGRTMP